MSNPDEARPWLLLLHQLPPKPAYFRVKVWRRLQALGAVAVKNSVYALPANDETREDFQWLLREIADGGGEACICEAMMVDGLSDAEIRALFDAARDADYRELADEARAVGEALRQGPDATTELTAEPRARLKRLRKRFAEIVAIDFFGANGRETTEGLLAELEARLAADGAVPAERPASDLPDLRGRTWVTRRGIQVDRMASTWLIRRFIDPAATFKFVPAKDYRPKPGELRFDMFEAEFTHDGDRCTFETLLARAGLDEPALQQIGEIIHDIDVEDGKFERVEAPGIAQLIAGIALTHEEDEARLEHSATVFDNLLEYFRRQRRSSGKTAGKT